MLDLQFKNPEPFGEYENKKRPRGRPRKKLSKKNIGSLIAENSSAPVILSRSILYEFQQFDAYTLEWIAPVRNSQVETKIAEFVADFRDIVNKKSRAFPALELSGVRCITPREQFAGFTLLDLRVVCTTFEAALFIFSHLAEKWCNKSLRKGYTGTALHLYGVEENLTNQRRAGSFDMETGGRWSSFFFESGDYWIKPAVDYSREMRAADYARVVAAAFRWFHPSHLVMQDFAIVRGAVGYCHTLNDDGTLKLNQPQIIYKGFRAVQNFGGFYNAKKRRVEYHRNGIPWYKWSV